MKKANYLLEKAADLYNLQLAFWKAKRGKKLRAERTGLPGAIGYAATGAARANPERRCGGRALPLL